MPGESVNGETVFLTGGTGFLGAHIAAGLIAGGYRVILSVRPRNGIAPVTRVRALLEWLAIESGDRLEVVEGDIRLPGLGLEAELVRDLRSRVNRVFHCAADTSFAVRKKPDIEAVNILGLKHVFHLFSGCTRFFHMSTAYVAGEREGLCPEALAETDRFNNPYEQSKYLAEKEIIRLCGLSGSRLTIFRPSIVYGHSKTGKSLRFNALYYPVRMVLNLRDAFLRDIRSGSGSRAKKMGVSLSPGGRLEMPVRVRDGGGGLDLVPIDHLVRAVLILMESGGEGIFHIVSARPKPLAELVDYIQAYSRVSGIRTVASEPRDASSPLEQVVDELMDPYKPYLSDRRRFDDARSAAVLEPAGCVCPDLDYAGFARCMDYAVEARWGNLIRF